MSVFLSERHRTILKEIEDRGKIIVSHLAEKMAVTPETIRKDLDLLEAEKKLTRVHGGAVKYTPNISEPMFRQKMNVQLEEKKKIGKLASRYVNNGDTIMLDVGTTTYQLANSLNGLQRVTIVTNSLAAAEIINRRLENKMFDGKLIVLGGNSNPEQKSVAGTLTKKMLNHFHFDKAFLSCGGVTVNDVYDYDLEESIITESVMKQARECFLLTDSSKLGSSSFCRISALNDFDYIICDKPMPNEWIDYISEDSLKWISP
ncbi:DeoR/GlpR family DNA-binding transcription regulator [Falsibacillus pallidus]|uniref:DeoR family transcriptional regulator n=1 Tax=Falsibacillus pallidus TaxID=493781 RepID=A0A370G4E4_9BACI|nr:DeoR/GlpR family DNA-binding transcription regulator [Falsibacillus pallidus]RDI36923.1 DeoR family transcriptional regulator [Falsibacillus pallidus]